MRLLSAYFALSVSVLALICPPIASAVVLVHYNFESAPNDTPDTATTVEPGVTATTLTVTGSSTTSTTTNPPSGGRARAITMNNFDDVFTTDNYYTFSLTPTTPGQALDLTDLTFRFNLSASNIPDQVSTYRLRYDDLANGAGDYVILPTTFTSNGSSIVTATFDLSGAEFANLASGINFRIDFIDSGSIASNASLRMDALTVNGGVVAAVPEPGVAALLALGAFGLLAKRRRSRA